jgi:hypothetical protein
MRATTYGACPVIRSEVKHFLKFRSGYPLRTLSGGASLAPREVFWLVSSALKGALPLPHALPDRVTASRADGWSGIGPHPYKLVGRLSNLGRKTPNISADAVRTGEIMRFMVLLRVVRGVCPARSRWSAHQDWRRILQFQLGVFVNRVVVQTLTYKKKQTI